MTLALLTHGYICPPSSSIPPGAEVGSGPSIVSVTEITPVIKHGRQTSPKIVKGVEND